MQRRSPLDGILFQSGDICIIATKFLQNMVLNIVFPGGEHATNLIIANMEVLVTTTATLTAFL